MQSLRCLLTSVFWGIGLVMVTGCGDITQDERVYGTWIEPLDGAIIEFRPNGTLSWDGTEGTFEFVRSTNWAVCGGRGGCDDGQISITLPDQSFRTSFYKSAFDSDPNRFYLSPRSTSGLVQDVSLYGHSVDAFSVYRQGSFSGTLMPETYQRVSDGIPGAFQLNTFMGDASYSGGTLVAEVGRKIRRFETATQQWVEVGGDQYDYVWPMNGEALHKNRRAFGETCRVSFDAGRTWKEVPHVEDFFSSGSQLAATMIGDTSVSLVRALEDGGGIEFWSMDVRAESPTWQKQSTLRVGNETYPAQSFLDAGVLVLESMVGTELTFQISVDLGVTWSTLVNPCYGRIAPHQGGFHCRNANSNLSWFTYATMAWTEYEVGFDLDSSGIANGGTVSDAAYLIDGNDVWIWRPEGAERVATLSDNITGNRGRVFVFDEAIFVNKLSLWRALR